jgi:hypothetical protein
MPPYLAIFFSIHGQAITIGLYTVDEFVARTQTSPDTKWARLINSKDGDVITRYNKEETK